jgi:hypothetical protein
VGFTPLLPTLANDNHAGKRKTKTLKIIISYSI